MGTLLILAAVLPAPGTASPNHPADQERQNAQSGNPAGSGNAALRRGSRRSGGCGRLLGVQGACQEKSRQRGGGKHAMLEKEPFHLSCKGKTGVHPIQTHLLRLSRFPDTVRANEISGTGITGKNHPWTSFLQKKLARLRQ